MANPKIKYLYLLMVVCLLAGCRKELSEYQLCKDEVTVEVERLLPDSLATFGGLNVRSINLVFFPRREGTLNEKKITGKEGKINLSPGRYDILIYTSDFYELDAVFYRGLTDPQTAEAYTKTIVSGGVSYIAEPDPLFSIYLTDIDLETDRHLLQNLEMRPLAFAYRFKVYVEGIEHVKSVSALVSGLYSTVFLKDGRHREEEEAQTVIPLQMKGSYIYGDFYSFGTHQDKEIGHRIAITFVNGKTETVELENLTAKLKAMPRGGEIEITQKITITGQGGSSGFIPGVSGWDDETTVPMPI